MNRTESVSIGRKGFICEQDAYKVLQDYLARSEKALSADPDQKEILADLELSMASHLTEISGELVVDKETASKVIALMGEVEVDAEPDDKSDDKADTNSSDQADDMSFADRVRAMFKKPLFKDHDREIGDGVCAGIARALDVDPVWVRLVFVLVTIMTQGLGIGLYIVLSIIMKEESTYKKKTAGEVVDSIRKKITTTANDARPYERALRKLIVGLFIVVWVILRTIVCLVLVGASIAWASYMFFMLNSPDQVAIFNGRPGWLEFVMVFSAGLVLLIPIFELLVAMFRPKGNRTRLSLGLWSVWALSLIALVASLVNVYPKVENYLKTEQPKNEYVYVQMVGSEIASWCISPLGNCSARYPILVDGVLCGRGVTLYDREDRIEWLDRMWEPVYKELDYPATEEQYCAIVNDVYERVGPGAVMFAGGTLNDPANTYDQVDATDGLPRKIWVFEYLILH